MRIAAVIAAGIVAATLALCYGAGIFDRLPLEERTAGPYYLLYRDNKGPYQGIKNVMSDVYAYVRYEKKSDVSRGFAIFYDDPRGKDKEQLRSSAGCITDSLVTDLKQPYLSRRFDSTHAVVGVFPLRTFFSYMTGTFKFYPRLGRYLAAHNLTLSGAVMEVYDMQQRRILYIAPVAK